MPKILTVMWVNESTAPVDKADGIPIRKAAMATQVAAFLRFQPRLSMKYADGASSIEMVDVMAAKNNSRKNKAPAM